MEGALPKKLFGKIVEWSKKKVFFFVTLVQARFIIPGGICNIVILGGAMRCSTQICHKAQFRLFIRSISLFPSVSRDISRCNLASFSKELRNRPYTIYSFVYICTQCI